MSMINVSVSVANNFVHSSTAADQGYHSSGELTRFIYCLLRKIRKASSLPPVEQWEEYVVPNHSQFPATDEKDFISGFRVMAALDKIGSQFLRTEFRRDARCFLEEFVKCILSTVASRSVIGQVMSCFRPAIVVGGDEVGPFQLLHKLLDGHLEKGSTRGSEVEAEWAEYQSIVQVQWQLERLSTRSRPGVGDVMSFCSAKPGFRALRHLCKLCIVPNRVISFAISLVVCFALEIMMFQVFQLTALVIFVPTTRGKKCMVSVDRIAIKEAEVRGGLLCVRDFVHSPHFTQRSSVPESGLTMLTESVAIADSITSSPVYASWGIVVLWTQHVQPKS